MSKNGILSDPTLPDPTPYLPPGVKKPKQISNDFRKLGRARKYKEVDQYCEARKEYWRHFTPDGNAFIKMVVENPQAALNYAAIASAVIQEIDELQTRIQLEK